jgi:carbonic anhydrase
VHGWIYGLSDGRLRDLGCTLAGPDDLHLAARLTHG